MAYLAYHFPDRMTWKEVVDATSLAHLKVGCFGTPVLVKIIQNIPYLDEPFKQWVANYTWNYWSFQSGNGIIGSFRFASNVTREFIKQGTLKWSSFSDA